MKRWFINLHAQHHPSKQRSQPWAKMPIGCVCISSRLKTQTEVFIWKQYVHDFKVGNHCWQRCCCCCIYVIYLRYFRWLTRTFFDRCQHRFGTILVRRSMNWFAKWGLHLWNVLLIASCCIVALIQLGASVFCLKISAVYLRNSW